MNEKRARITTPESLQSGGVVSKREIGLATNKIDHPGRVQGSLLGSVAK